MTCIILNECINGANCVTNVMLPPAEQGFEETITSCVRGYHIYNWVRTATVGEMLRCARKAGIVVDGYAVSMLKNHNIVGHLRNKVPKFVLFFFQCGSSISCEVARVRRYSTDLQQGGIEVPFILIVKGRKIVCLDGDSNDKPTVMQSRSMARSQCWYR